MRSQEDIRQSLDQLSENTGPLKARGDNFRFGLWVGKQLALEWILENVTSGELRKDYGYKDWYQDYEADGKDLRGFLQNGNTPS